MGLTRITAQQISDSDFKQSVRVVTTSNTNLSGAPSTVDGVALAVNNRILVTGQTTASQNGLYYVTSVGTGSDGTWTRTLDGNETGEISSGMIVVVTEGTAYADSEWLLTTNDPIVIGTTGLAFIQINGTIYSGTSNVVVNNSGNVTISSAGTANVVTVATTGAYVTGLISTTGNVNTANLYVTTDAVVAGNLTVNGTTTTINSNTITTNDKNITVANNQTTSAAVDGAGLDAGGGTPIATWRYSNATTSWQSNVALTPTANGSLALGGASNFWGTAYLTTVSATGNITGSYIIGNGSQLTGLPASYGNANVVANLAALGSNPVSTTGNVTAGYFLGNGALLTGVITSVSNISSGNSNVAVTTAAGNVAVSIGGTSNVVVYATTGEYVTGLISATGNITGGNANITGTTAATSKTTGALVVGGGVGVASDVWAGNSITVDGGAYGNVVITQFASVFATGSGPNPRSIMQVRGADNVSGIGIQGVSSGNGQIYANTGIIFTTGATLRDKDYPTGGTTRATLDSTGLTVTGLVSATGNITGGNVISNGVRAYKWTTVANTAPSNPVPGDNWYDSYADKKYQYVNDGTSNAWVDQSFPTTYASLTITGNTTSGNLLTGGAVSATGNITSAGNVSGTYILGNGSQLSGLPVTYGNSNVTSLLAAYGSNAIYTTGNITGGNLLTSGLISTTGNITSGNLLTPGLISATGNVTGTNLFGTIQTATQLNITAIGTLSSLTVSGNTTSGNLLTGGLISVTGNITGGNVTAAGVLLVNTANTAQAITNGGANGVGNIGSATTYFNTVFAKATSAQYADLAEMYVADADYEPGTVVDFGGVEEITQTVSPCSTAVAGVISTNPSYIMNSGQQGKYVLPVALTGRVPCRVQGPVSKGDVLISSTIPGVAQRIGTHWEPGCIIGKSLGYIDDSSIQTIEVVVGRT